MTKRKSIGMRLNSCRNPATRREIATNWATDRADETTKLISRLEQALAADDYDEQCIALGQLKAVNQKVWAALPSIIQKL